ncbi:MAG: hypothetical protein M3R51_08870 [Candidatus Eremiobacteraeota bacterium]|nr:hypothetical protein [Candidatus Eremiobacteraeota bacterium]
MATIKELEEAIFEREGFRVRIEPLEKKAKALPAYAFAYMAYSKWKISQWQTVRLAKYIPYLRSITVLRPDGKRAASGLQLGNLRDAYFKAFCADEPASAETPVR